MSYSKRPGRKQKHITAKGETVVGLTRRPDGRWRVIGTHQTFRKSDEARAVERFRRLTDPRREFKEKYGDFSFQGSVIDELSKGFAVIDEGRMWKWIGDQIRTRPKWFAEKVGIEEIGYLDELTPPEKLPTLGVRSGGIMPK